MVTPVAHATENEFDASAPFDASKPYQSREMVNDVSSDQSGLILESLKASNYENMSLEEVQKVLKKKQELAKTLENQLRIKQTRDQQKRALLDQLQRIDEENKKILLELKQPFKR